MSFQIPITIADAIQNIRDSKYLLPAIQREFEWPSQKIEWLFDSLMRGYPVSSFLFWSVEGETVSGYKFYEFLRHYRERYKTHNVDADISGLSNIIAVLDGQQRLTSLYIGLVGSYAYKEKNRHWNDDEWSIPSRHLYLNFTRKLDEYEEEDGRVYEFSFLKESDTKQADVYRKKWFRVGKIWELKNISIFNKFVRDNNFDDLGADILARLQEVIFTERIINFFLEKEQDLQKALNIFIRINSGGLPLNFADLIMSIAVANWKVKDARKEIHALVDRIQEDGFTISKEFIFKAYLYLYSKDIRFKVTNFSSDNAHNFEKDWDEIRDAIQSTFELIKTFGYTDFTLMSKNAVIPIVYYVYHRGIFRDFSTKTQYKDDRVTMMKWLQVITIKRIFGGQSDGTLSQIRKAFTLDVTDKVKVPVNYNLFPVDEINNQIKRDVSVGDDFIEELLKTQKDDRYAFSILSLLFPQLDYKNNDFHKDHLHPISCFTKENADKMGLTSSEKEIFLSSDWNNSIINLQMLDSNENKSKQARSLKEWFDLETKSKDPDLFRQRCIIPDKVSLNFKDFVAFAKVRQAELKYRLKLLLM